MKRFYTLSRRINKSFRKELDIRNKKSDLTNAHGILKHEIINKVIPSYGLEEHQTSNDLDTIQANWNGSASQVKNVLITHQSANGEGLAVVEHQGALKLVVVPYTLKGDTVDLELKRHYELYCEAKLVNIVEPSLDRDDSLVKCAHFGKCSGCQFQMTDYQNQLLWKQKVVKQAYDMFFPSQEFQISPTIASPNKFHYRTKITPHFQKPKGSSPDSVSVGFNDCFRSVVDVEHCPISTSLVNCGLREERERIESNIHLFESGQSLLVRESLQEGGAWGYATNHKEEIRELVEGKLFQFPAHTFFQVNRSILPSTLQLVRKHLGSPKNLIDTYCGSGFFGIGLADCVEQIYGIEISSKSIEFAKRNAALNNVTNATYMTGTAEGIFGNLKNVNPRETVVIMDPSRAGSNAKFLRQLSDFGPQKIIYLSCNVFSQARDIRSFFDITERYNIEEIIGLDFFPQTKHVESLVVLTSRD